MMLPHYAALKVFFHGFDSLENIACRKTFVQHPVGRSTMEEVVEEFLLDFQAAFSVAIRSCFLLLLLRVDDLDNACLGVWMTVWWMPTWWMLVDHPGVFDDVSTPGWSSWLEDPRSQ